MNSNIRIPVIFIFVLILLILLVATAPFWYWKNEFCTGEQKFENNNALNLCIKNDTISGYLSDTDKRITLKSEKLGQIVRFLSDCFTEKCKIRQSNSLCTHIAENSTLQVQVCFNNVTNWSTVVFWQSITLNTSEVLSLIKIYRKLSAGLT